MGACSPSTGSPSFRSLSACDLSTFTSSFHVVCGGLCWWTSPWRVGSWGWDGRSCIGAWTIVYTFMSKHHRVWSLLIVQILCDLNFPNLNFMKLHSHRLPQHFHGPDLILPLLLQIYFLINFNHVLIRIRTQSESSTSSTHSCISSVTFNDNISIVYCTYTGNQLQVTPTVCILLTLSTSD